MCNFQDDILVHISLDTVASIQTFSSFAAWWW